MEELKSVLCAGLLVSQFTHSGCSVPSTAAALWEMRCGLLLMSLFDTEWRWSFVFAELLFRERAPYSAMIKISFIPESWHREWTLNRYMDRLSVGFISGALPAEVFRTRHRSSCNNSFRVSHGPGEKGALAVTQARILLSLAFTYSFCLKCYVSWLAELFRWCLEACLIWALYYRSTSEGGSWITRWHLVLVKWASRLLHARCVTNKQRENVRRLSANYSR